MERSMSLIWHTRRRMAIGRIRAGAMRDGHVSILRHRVDQITPGQCSGGNRWRKARSRLLRGATTSAQVIVRPGFSEGAAAFSPDGRRLAFWTENGENGLKIIDLTTGLVCCDVRPGADQRSHRDDVHGR